jgi:hypothetical protein
LPNLNLLLAPSKDIQCGFMRSQLARMVGL